MRLLFRSVLLASLAVPALLAAVPAVHAQTQIDSREGIALQNQIYQLRQEMKQLQDQRSAGGQAYGGQSYGAQPRLSGNASDLLTQLLSRVDSLEDQVRQLRGRIDETQNQMQQQNAALNKKIDDLKFQIDSGTGAAGMSASAKPAAPMPMGQLSPSSAYGSAPPGYGSPPGYGGQPAPYSGVQGGGAPVNLMAPQPAAPGMQPVPPRPPGSGPRTPEVAMLDGTNALARRDYASAEAAAREVLANRTSPRIYDAKLMLAQALEGQKQFPQAAIAFDDTYNMSRKGSHAEDALLGLASSLAAIKEDKAACDTLSRLRADFPQIRPDLKAGVAAVQQKAACR